MDYRPASDQSVEPVGLAAWRCHHRLHVLVARPGQEVVRRAGLDQPARVQHGDAVGEQHRLDHVVGDHDRRQLELVMELAIIVGECLAGKRIERAERLVHEHHMRPRR